MNDQEWLDKLCEKFYNIERNGLWVEKDFNFNGKYFHVSSYLSCNGNHSTEEELKEFREEYIKFNQV